MISTILFISSYILNTAGPKILFFTGGNSLMSDEIYSDFLSRLKQKYSVDTIQNSNKDSSLVLEKLLEFSTEKEIVPIGHSSGCTTLLNYCHNLKNIKKTILMDPVSNNLIDKNKPYNFESTLQINAEKSYKWQVKDSFPYNPLPKVPFIPLFSMDTKDFTNLSKVEVHGAGHCDILDTSFSNFMHNSLAEGLNNRDLLPVYKDFMVDLMDCYIRNVDYNTGLKKYSNSLNFTCT